ncbi:MAG: AAA family ATPase [Bacteroidetes bacterium]|nr:MAG: AAA family ATPase [Bacteroidota bacterium]
MDKGEQLRLFPVWDNPIEDLVFGFFAEGESTQLEYKSAKGGFPDSFWETYSAFANTEGGIIILGVREKDYRLYVDGLSEQQMQQYRRNFFDTSHNRNKISHNLLNDDDVKVLPIPEQEGAYLLAFQVPRARPEQMPVYKGADMFTGTFKRNDAGDYRCDRDAVRRMVGDSNPSSPSDSKILRNFTLADLDTQSLQQYRQLMATRKPDHPWLVLDAKLFLQKLGAWRKDRSSGIEGVTLAGLVMFGKTEAINDPDAAPAFFLDYQEILTQEAALRWTDRIYPDGTWEANLFQFYQRVWPRLSAGLPRPFQLVNGTRQDETPAHVALRESFVNALIHADYTAVGNLTVTRRLTAFEFKNPGTLLISQRQYYEGGTSVCRNKALQKMFMLIGRAEQAGSGSGKIVAGWQSAQWQRPYLELKDQPDQVILVLNMESVLPEDVLKRLGKLFGNKAAEFFGHELQVLSLAVQESQVTNQRLQYFLDLHRVDISLLLKQLCQDGFLVPSGKGRGTVYVLPEVYPNKILIGENFNKAPASGENLDTSGENLDTSGENLDTSGENLDTSGGSNMSTTRSNSQKRFKTPQAILNFVSNKYETAEAIGEAVGRSVTYLKNEILPKMVTDGSLLLLHPHKKNHPAQAYKANANQNNMDV